MRQIAWPVLTMLVLPLLAGVNPALAGPQVPLTPVADPIAAITASGITVRLAPFTTVPNGAPQLIQSVGDGSGRLAINETGGRVFLTGSAGGALGTPYMDMNSAASGFIGGLMGLAFHPDFASNGKFYTGSYAAPGTGIAPLVSSGGTVNDVVVTEWTASTPGAATFSGTRREVLRVAQPSEGHAIGMVAFNPNATSSAHPDYGKLYVSMGDAGDNGSYLTNGQNTANPYGKVLRIDPTPSAGNPFTVPTDNPFVGQATKEPTIWAYGFRNPQYLSWMRGGAGTMFINDIGEANIEEVNTGVAGGNYGWSIREGGFATFRDPAVGPDYSTDVFLLDPGPDLGLLYPIAEYDHGEGRAIGAGLLYQGAAVPGLTGKFIASDIVSGRLFVTDVDGLLSDSDPAGSVGFAYLDTVLNDINQSLVAALGVARADARLGTDGEGNLYVLTKARGDIFRVETFVSTVPAPASLPLLVVALAGLAGVRRGRR